MTWCSNVVEFGALYVREIESSGTSAEQRQTLLGDGDVIYFARLSVVGSNNDVSIFDNGSTFNLPSYPSSASTVNFTVSLLNCSEVIFYATTQAGF